MWERSIHFKGSVGSDEADNRCSGKGNNRPVVSACVDREGRDKKMSTAS